MSKEKVIKIRTLDNLFVKYKLFSSISSENTAIFYSIIFSSPLFNHRQKKGEMTKIMNVFVPLSADLALLLLILNLSAQKVA